MPDWILAILLIVGLPSLGAVVYYLSKNLGQHWLEQKATKQLKAEQLQKDRDSNERVRLESLRLDDKLRRERRAELAEIKKRAMEALKGKKRLSLRIFFRLPALFNGLLIGMVERAQAAKQLAESTITDLTAKLKTVQERLDYSVPPEYETDTVVRQQYHTLLRHQKDLETWEEQLKTETEDLREAESDFQKKTEYQNQLFALREKELGIHSLTLEQQVRELKLLEKGQELHLQEERIDQKQRFLSQERSLAEEQFQNQKQALMLQDKENQLMVRERELKLEVMTEALKNQKQEVIIEAVKQILSMKEEELKLEKMRFDDEMYVRGGQLSLQQDRLNLTIKRLELAESQEDFNYMERELRSERKQLDWKVKVLKMFVDRHAWVTGKVPSVLRWIIFATPKIWQNTKNE